MHSTMYFVQIQTLMMNITQVVLQRASSKRDSLEQANANFFQQKKLKEGVQTRVGYAVADYVEYAE